ncbi:hypothetical protein M427DRAFT_225895 [Gonapodya prolifera JEL478]|uniref:Uncharacterized protein n=1 Tax=Gonapodya prolifera (strain JEL478) TaxID=1344416 RepID=A0A139ANE2_GONPJ|nr:hypothetical protein M427DRAFT_225895 [Gonapodya prolifera JEL478]|eukprot:KXS18271.1 hypothetical protein M427DRAFT_225895 [Gonapodya prolifera JEL478]
MSFSTLAKIMHHDIREVKCALASCSSCRRANLKLFDTEASAAIRRLEKRQREGVGNSEPRRSVGE